jgi:hypothetical protein
MALKLTPNNIARFDDSMSEIMQFHNKQNGNTTDNETITLPHGKAISSGTKGIAQMW